MSLVPLELYLSLQPDCPAATRECLEGVARARWCLQAHLSGLEPAWPSVVSEVTPWGVLVRGFLWRPLLHAEASVAHQS